MEVKTVRKFLLACRSAKRIVDMLPELPEGIGPRDLRILDVISELSERGQVRISDVSARLGIARPSVTRDISRLEREGHLQKNPSPDDKRIVFVSLTESGRELQRVYAEEYHEHLAELFSGFEDSQFEQVADTINAVNDLLAADRARGGER